MIFAYLQAALCLLAMIEYSLKQDIKHTLYWLLAGLISLVVTWMN